MYEFLLPKTLPKQSVLYLFVFEGINHVGGWFFEFVDNQYVMQRLVRIQDAIIFSVGKSTSAI